MTGFLKICLPKWTKSKTENLNCYLLVKEIGFVIKNLQLRKPDSFTSESCETV